MATMGRPPKYKDGYASCTFSYERKVINGLKKELKKIAGVEGSTVGELIVKSIDEYLERHKKGNPQLHIEEVLRPTGHRVAEIAYAKKRLEKWIKLASGKGEGEKEFLEKAWRELIKLERLANIEQDKELFKFYEEMRVKILEWREGKLA